MVVVAEKPKGVVGAQKQSRAGYITAVKAGQVISDDVTLANELAARIQELQKCEGYACDSKMGYMTTVTRKNEVLGMPAVGGEAVPDKLGQQKTITINFSRMQDDKLYRELSYLQKYLIDNADKQEKTRVVFYGNLDRNSPAARVFADIARDERGLLKGAVYQRTGLSGVDLSECDFRDGRFVGVDLEGATVSGANFSGATMRGVKLREVDGRPTDAGKTTQFYGADLTNADCTRANFQQSNFTLAEIAGTNFSFSNLTNACFQLMDQAQWKLANFKDAVRTDWKRSWGTSPRRCQELQLKAGASGGIVGRFSAMLRNGLCAR